jgi:hypothetical protein
MQLAELVLNGLRCFVAEVQTEEREKRLAALCVQFDLSIWPQQAWHRLAEAPQQAVPLQFVCNRSTTNTTQTMQQRINLLELHPSQGYSMICFRKLQTERRAGACRVGLFRRPPDPSLARRLHLKAVQSQLGVENGLHSAVSSFRR